MSRLSATLWLDARLQIRNNVYAIIAIAALGVALALRALFQPEQLEFFMPVLALSGIGITAFFLVSVLVLLERGEGTLDVVLVSPLRPSEYLASKVLTVAVLALVESLLLVLPAYGLDFSLPWLTVAVLLRAGFAAAVGLAVGVRYRSITRFLMPAIGCTIALDLPLLFYFGLWQTSLFYLWPTLPSLLLAKAAFVPVEPGQLVYGVTYGVVACGAAVFWARRSIERYVVRGRVRS